VFLVALVSFGQLSAASEPIVPFIKDKFWKQNISMKEFRQSPRNYFRSEAAFHLLRDYVSDEIGVRLSSAEFIALIRDDNRINVVNCFPSEALNVGALKGNQFDWVQRWCREGEQIVQIFYEDQWRDVFSLSCLNAVEDKTPVDPPVFTTASTADKLVCFDVPFDGYQHDHEYEHFHLDGMYHRSCSGACGCGSVLFVRDLTMLTVNDNTSRGSTEVCVPQSEFKSR
jgi:hypothetical protein